MEWPTHIQDKLDELGILASDVEMRFIKGRGPGGQKINKTSSTVVLTHHPTGVEVRLQSERSQTANRWAAWETLLKKLEERRDVARAERVSAREKLRRQNRQRSRSQKKRLVAGKRKRGETKALRSRVNSD